MGDTSVLSVGSIDAWRDELASFLSSTFGADSAASLSLLCPLRDVEDEVMKLLVRDEAGRKAAVVLCSNSAAPDMVARGGRKANEAKRLLGPDLGQVILEPIQEGFVDQVSYAVLPYCEPLANSRLRGVLQKRKIVPAMLGWLLETAQYTARSLEGQELETNFSAPLRGLAEMEDASAEIRRAAAETLERVQDGKWSPRHMLMHNDLWAGNVLLESNRFGFVVIDWPGSQCDGYGIFDLLRFADSMGVRPKALRREVENHCRALSCDFEDARSHLTAALAELATRLEHFPVKSFVDMSNRSLRVLSQL